MFCKFFLLIQNAHPLIFFPDSHFLTDFMHTGSKLETNSDPRKVNNFQNYALTLGDDLLKIPF